LFEVIRSITQTGQDSAVTAGEIPGSVPSEQQARERLWLEMLYKMAANSTTMVSKTY